jgi:hypothetical protein
MGERLPASLEATAIMRQVQAGGGFAAVLKRGDPDRGALMLVIRERGELKAILERELGPDFEYRWAVRKADEAPGSTRFDEFIASRVRFDADSWLIELDIADPERFIAETTASG